MAVSFIVILFVPILLCAFLPRYRGTILPRLGRTMLAASVRLTERVCLLCEIPTSFFCQVHLIFFAYFTHANGARHGCSRFSLFLCFPRTTDFLLMFRLFFAFFCNNFVDFSKAEHSCLTGPYLLKRWVGTFLCFLCAEFGVTRCSKSLLLYCGYWFPSPSLLSLISGCFVFSCLKSSLFEKTRLSESARLSFFLPSRSARGLRIKTDPLSPFRVGPFPGAVLVFPFSPRCF